MFAPCHQALRCLYGQRTGRHQANIRHLKSIDPGKRARDRAFPGVFPVVGLFHFSTKFADVQVLKLCSD